MKPVSDLGSGVFLGKVTQEFPQSFAGNRPRWASFQGCFGTPELSLLAFNSVRNMSGNMVLQIWNSWIPVEWEQLSLVGGHELHDFSSRPRFRP